MTALSPAYTMIALDLMMIIYSLWVVFAFPSGATLAKKKLGIAIALLGWLLLLHIALSTKSLFPSDISSIGFFAAILGGVGVVGMLLLLIPPIRSLMLSLSQTQLLGLQGIRVFFGAGFLVQACLGTLPMTFGIIDGLTHISAGFLGLVAALSSSLNLDANRRVWFANAFGLADILIVASSLAFILLPQIGPHHSMMYAVFLPAPLWLWFHLISMYKLVRKI
jgi:hypothetical protein